MTPHLQDGSVRCGSSGVLQSARRGVQHARLRAFGKDSSCEAQQRGEFWLLSLELVQVQLQALHQTQQRLDLSKQTMFGKMQGFCLGK